MHILGGASESSALDHEAHLGEQPIRELVQLPAKRPQVPSELSFHSSFFSYTIDSPSWGEPRLTSKSPAFTMSSSRAASPRSRTPSQRTGSLSPQSQPVAPASLSAVHEAERRLDMKDEKTFLLSSSLSSSAVLGGTCCTTSQLTTPSLTVPLPLVAARTMATQVLPRCTDVEGQHHSRASQLPRTSSPPSSLTSRTADRPRGEEYELRRSGSSAKEPGVADTVLTLPLAALGEVPLPTPRLSSSSFSASLPAVSPLSALAASFSETPSCTPLSHLATTLLYTDDADPLADELRAESRINAAALSWVPLPLPTIPTKKSRLQRRAATRPPHLGDHSDGQCVSEVGAHPAVKQMWTRRKTKKGAVPTGEVISVVQGGMLTPATLPQQPSSAGRRRTSSKAATKGTDQSAFATMASNAAEPVPIPGPAAALNQSEVREGLRSLTESSTRHTPAFRTDLEHLSLSATFPKQSKRHRQQELAVLADDVPLFDLFATGSYLSANATSMAPAACQSPVTPLVSPLSQGERLKRTRRRMAGVPQAEAAGVEDRAAPSAGRVAVETRRDGADTASATAASLPPPLSSPSAPQVLARSEELEGGGTGRTLPASGGFSAAPSRSETGGRKTPTSSPTLSVRKGRKSQWTPAASTDTPSCSGDGSSNDCNGAVTQAVSSVKCAADMQPSPLQAWWSAVCTSGSSSESGRSCLWIELAEGYQETHETLLRQVLVYWGCLHRESCVNSCGALELPINASPLSSSSPSNCSSRKRARNRKRTETNPASDIAPLKDAGRRDNNGLVVLLCPSSLPMEEALRWWTQRTHVEHSFMPPLLAVSMSVDSSSSAARRADRVPSVSREVPTLEEEHELFRGAIEQASRMYCTDPARSLAVSCSAAGHAALTQVLSLGQVFENLQVCADVLRSTAGFPPTSSVVKTLLEEDADVGSLAAALAVTAPTRDTRSSNAGERRCAASLQDRCFAELCRWNDLAAALQRQPRRPLLVLRRMCVDTLHRNDGTSKAPPKGAGVTGSLSTLMGDSEGVLSTSSVACSSLLSQQRRQWVTYGMVLPATRNEDTFASSACREDRVLASQPPPVALAPLYLSALHLFGRILFASHNYATAVNVVESYARVSQRCLSDYLSGYSCVATGPLRYAVSATIRRYLQVRVQVALAPLLALVSEGAAAQQLTSTRPSASGACVSLPSIPTSLAPVVLLARSTWRTVVPSLSCTCNPHLYEQVPRTDDGVKVCRHLAELFHYFITQQFSVVAHQAEPKEQSLQRHQLQSAPTGVDAMPFSRSPQASLCTTLLRKRQLSRCSRSHTSTNNFSSSASHTLSSLPFPVPYASSPDLCAGSERTVRKQERNEAPESEGTDSTSSTGPSAQHHLLQHSVTAALSPAKRSNAPRTRPSKMVQRSSPVEAANASVASSAGTSAAGTDFHTQALQYALRLLHERMRDGSGGRSADGGAVSLAAAATGECDSLFHTSGPPAHVRKRTRSDGGTSREAERVRALQLVEQLLRDQLR
ncbi:conserved hypothetical protein [Leishmania braziliensis MHOM/BR/75/M2904]|uniref:SWIM-type domain-containing protein n=1 Tax=Leishmania braziliensis TaxID=5660 RepID=A4HKV5_LEIBR|nr:conserved hypothetical protein [Leishmania braziliensis MHOM/BR/75/M2904]CAJ2478860.1 unnamed protein product [Leishmania braziliensis]CAM43134.2 conserved hypothetical protein [Leishmania braziliensis MHOM/BR/75/M2904]